MQIKTIRPFYYTSLMIGYTVVDYRFAVHVLCIILSSPPPLELAQHRNDIYIMSVDDTVMQVRRQNLYLINSF